MFSFNFNCFYRCQFIKDDGDIPGEDADLVVDIRFHEKLSMVKKFKLVLKFLGTEVLDVPRLDRVGREDRAVQLHGEHQHVVVMSYHRLIHNLIYELGVIRIDMIQT